MIARGDYVSRGREPDDSVNVSDKEEKPSLGWLEWRCFIGMGYSLAAYGNSYLIVTESRPKFPSATSTLIYNPYEPTLTDLGSRA